MRTEAGPCYGPTCDHVSHRGTTEPILIEIYGTDTSVAAEVLQMQDPEAAIHMGQDQSHRWGVREVIVMTESRLRLAQFTGWTLWKPEAAHRNVSDEAGCSFDHRWNDEPDDA